MARGETPQEARKRIWGEAQAAKKRPSGIGTGNGNRNGTPGSPREDALRPREELLRPREEQATSRPRLREARDRLRALRESNKFSLRPPPRERPSAPAPQDRPAQETASAAEEPPAAATAPQEVAASPTVQEQPASTAPVVQEEPTGAEPAVEEQAAPAAPAVQERPAAHERPVAPAQEQPVVPAQEQAVETAAPREEAAAPVLEEPPKPSSEREPEPSVDELMKQLSGQSSTIARQEKRLAQLERQAKGVPAGISLGAATAALVVGLMGVAAIVTAVVMALDTELKGWASSAIVGIALVAIAVGVVMYGRNRPGQ